MLLKDAVLDLRKGRRYGVVFCPPTREGHQSHQSSWWVGCELCLKSTWLPPGNPPWKPSWILNPPQTQTGLHHNLRWVAMVRERPPWWVPSLLEVFQAWPPKWKPCTWSRRRRKNWSQMVWVVKRLLNRSCKKLTKWLFKMGVNNFRWGGVMDSYYMKWIEMM